MSVMLANLGYEYEEMLELSPGEIDFIFPNTELIANLVDIMSRMSKHGSFSGQGKPIKRLSGRPCRKRK